MESFRRINKIDDEVTFSLIHDFFKEKIFSSSLFIAGGHRPSELITSQSIDGIYFLTVDDHGFKVVIRTTKTAYEFLVNSKHYLDLEIDRGQLLFHGWGNGMSRYVTFAIQ